MTKDIEWFLVSNKIYDDIMNYIVKI